MKKLLTVFVVAHLMYANQVYAENGDLIVNGKLGVGTSTPGATLLDVRYKDASTNLYRASDSTGLYRWRIDQLFNMVMTTSAGQDIMAIYNNGKVGIGGISIEPGTESPNSGAIRFGDNTGWKLHFGRSRDSVGGLLNTGTQGVLLTVNDNGNVGIGTTSPSFKLDLNEGTIGYGASNTRTEYKNDAGAMSGQSGFFQTANPTNYPAGASSWWHLLDVRHSNTTNNFALQIAGSFFDQNLYFRKVNNNPATGWKKFVVQDSSGSVWLDGVLGSNSGSLSPYGALTVQGSKNGWSGINFRDSNGNNQGTLMMNSFYSGFYDALDLHWNFYATIGGNTYANAYLYLSEVSLKKDIETLPNTIDKLKTVRGVYYKWKDAKQDQNRQLGVIAEEVESAFPELVKEIDNPQCGPNLSHGCELPKVKAVDYPKLAAVALQGVKELSEKIEKQQKAINDHEKELIEIRSLLAKLGKQ